MGSKGDLKEETHLLIWNTEMSLQSGFPQETKCFSPLDRISLNVYRQKLFALLCIFYNLTL